MRVLTVEEVAEVSGNGAWGAALGTIVGGVAGELYGAEIGAAIGALGGLLGPEVGIPSTAVGAAVGARWGGLIGGAIGQAIGDKIGDLIGDAVKGVDTATHNDSGTFTQQDEDAMMNVVKNEENTYDQQGLNAYESGGINGVFQDIDNNFGTQWQLGYSGAFGSSGSPGTGFGAGSGISQS